MKRSSNSVAQGRDLYTLFVLLAAAIALGLGLTLAAPAHGETLHQAGGGKLIGTVTIAGVPAPSIAVELRQRTNGGADTLLATTKSDATGTYSFVNQPSAPSDAFYYVRLTGGTGTLSVWYTFPIIYLTGTDFTVPGVDVGDVQLVSPAPDARISGGSVIAWKARHAGETYRLFIYAAGKTDKPALDSGSLGTGTEYTLAGGSLPDGKYEAVVQVRDAVVGYGTSTAHFRFTVGPEVQAQPPVEQSTPQLQSQVPTTVVAAPSTGSGQTGDSEGQPPAQQAPQQAATEAPTDVPTEAPTDAPTDVPTPQPQPTDTPQPLPPTATAQPTRPATQQPQPTEQPSATTIVAAEPPSAKPSVKVNLSADKTSVEAGAGMTYQIEIRNDGNAPASEVVVTDNLPANVAIDPARMHSSAGSIAASGNTVIVQVGDLAPNTSAVVQIPVQVTDKAGTNVSNQASAQYKDSTEPVQSNAFIAEVAAPVSGPSSSQPQAPAGSPQGSTQGSAPKAPTGGNSQAPAASRPAAPSGSTPKAPTSGAPKAPVQQPVKQIPQTGGSFPLVLALSLLAITMLARYLRGTRLRRR